MVDDQTYRDTVRGICPPRKGQPPTRPKGEPDPTLPEPRIALLQDEPIFRRLCMAYLVEQRKKGDMVLPTEHNVDNYAALFRIYATGLLPGYTLMIGDYAMIVHGEQPNALDMEPGRCAFIWLSYCKPEHRGRGITYRFHKYGMERLPGMGFNFTMFQTRADNEMPIRAMKGAVDGRQGVGEGKPYVVTWWWVFDKPAT